MTAAIIEICFLNILFFIMIFVLRNVEDKFNMNWELQRVTVCKGVFDFLYLARLLFFPETGFVVFGFFIYFEVVMCIIILYISVIEPIRGSYKTNDIIPFPVNEQVIRNAESSMTHEISSRFFYEFLYRDLKDTRSLAVFALYSDLRRYGILCDSKEAS